MRIESGAGPTVEVAVVGAGIAGLHAARLLQEGGRSVVVLEASTTVGGRLRSTPAGSGVLDLGASWFWPGEPRVQALIRELGLPVHAQYRAGAALYQDARGVRRLEGNSIDVPAGRFSIGAASLAERTAARLAGGTVRLADPVRAIEPAPDGVRIVASSEVLARHVVLAVPPATVSRIELPASISPDLRALLEQTPTWMGAITKVVARYARPFWRDAGLAGAAISHVGPLREVHDLSGPGGDPPALFGFASAPPGGRVDADEVRAQLGTLFGPEASTPVELILEDWREAEWISPPGAERMQAFHLYGHPLFSRPHLGGRLHFASTETAPEFAGHIEGALAAAERAVEAISRTE